MIKKIGLPLMALAAVLAFGAPKQADAQVRFGVGVGIGGPAYVAPAPYVAPYAPYGYCSVYDPYCAGYAPYVGPSVGIGLGWGGGYGYGYGHPAIVNRGYGGGFRGGYGGGFHGNAVRGGGGFHGGGRR